MKNLLLILATVLFILPFSEKSFANKPNRTLVPSCTTCTPGADGLVDVMFTGSGYPLNTNILVDVKNQYGEFFFTEYQSDAVGNIAFTLNFSAGISSICVSDYQRLMQHSRLDACVVINVN